MTRRKAALGADTTAVLTILGAQVRAARAARRWTAAELGSRAAVSARTVTAIERADPNVTLGNAIEVALVAGVDLFGAQHPETLGALARAHEQAAHLLPRRVRRPEAREEPDLDF